MKRTFWTSLVLAAAAIFLVLSVLLRSAFAIESTQTTNQKIQDTLELRHEGSVERREEIKDKTASKSAQIRQRAIKRLKEVFIKILDRYKAALNRLNKIQEKLNTRIVRLDANNVDTSSSEAKLADCANKKTAAETAISDAKSKIAAIDPTSTTVRDTVKTSVDALHKAKESIRAYHKCLVDVTRTLKTSSKEGTRSAK